MVRAQEGVDCMELKPALLRPVPGPPIRYEKNMMPMPKGAPAQATANFAQTARKARTRRNCDRGLRPRRRS